MTNIYWEGLNKRPVTYKIEILNKVGNRDSITTFDFSSLRTKILFNKLLKVFPELRDFLFWKMVQENTFFILLSTRLISSLRSVF